MWNSQRRTSISWGDLRLNNLHNRNPAIDDDNSHLCCVSSFKFSCVNLTWSKKEITLRMCYLIINHYNLVHEQYACIGQQILLFQSDTQCFRLETDISVTLIKTSGLNPLTVHILIESLFTFQDYGGSIYLKMAIDFELNNCVG